jgi:hypothetical protein
MRLIAQLVLGDMGDPDPEHSQPPIRPPGIERPYEPPKGGGGTGGTGGSASGMGGKGCGEPNTGDSDNGGNDTSNIVPVIIGVGVIAVGIILIITPIPGDEAVLIGAGAGLVL